MEKEKIIISTSEKHLSDSISEKDLPTSTYTPKDFDKMEAGKMYAFGRSLQKEKNFECFWHPEKLKGIYAREESWGGNSQWLLTENGNLYIYAKELN